MHINYGEGFNVLNKDNAKSYFNTARAVADTLINNAPKSQGGEPMPGTFLPSPVPVSSRHRRFFGFTGPNT